MLWGSRFEKKIDKSALDFTSSLSFDINLFRWDIKVSKAHAKMLAKIEILSEEEYTKIVNGLNLIEMQYIAGNWIPSRNEFEDIHSAIEHALIELIGPLAKKLHTARSRNDQVATDLRLWLKNAINELLASISLLQKKLIFIAENNTDTIIPGYTHLQRAQPVSLAFHLLAYVEMFERDKNRLKFTFQESDISPLGSGALAGTTIEIDRELTAKELGFKAITNNALDAVSDRDFAVDFLNACNLGMMHLSRFSEEIILWLSSEWNFAQLGDEFTTGSSLMPQKKNPDIPELIRGKSGRTYGNYISLLTILKSLPLSYNRDLQEDKEPVFDSFNTFISSVDILTSALSSLKINQDKFRDEIDGSFMLTTDLADYLVKKGIPFREAHNILGSVVKYAISQDKKLNQLTLFEYQQFSDQFSEDVFGYLKVENCLNNKTSYGSPNTEMTKKSLEDWKRKLSKDK